MSTYRSAKGGSNMQASKEKVGRFEGWIREGVPTDQEREEQRQSEAWQYALNNDVAVSERMAANQDGYEVSWNQPAADYGAVDYYQRNHSEFAVNNQGFSANDSSAGYYQSNTEYDLGSGNNTAAINNGGARNYEMQEATDDMVDAINANEKKKRKQKSKGKHSKSKVNSDLRL